MIIIFNNNNKLYYNVHIILTFKHLNQSQARLSLSLVFNFLLWIFKIYIFSEISESRQSFLNSQGGESGGGVLKPALLHHLGQDFQWLKL